VFPSNVQILRKPAESRVSFTSNFRGFDTVRVVRELFGDEVASVLSGLEVEFTYETLYMRVSNADGRLLINPNYFLAADFTDLYLDVIHELVHVKQFLDGKCSDSRTAYVERPLEIEAYNITVAEARNIGLDENEIIAYLNSDLLSNEELGQLAGTLGVECFIGVG
jgi:hypothetical protein